MDDTSDGGTLGTVRFPFINLRKAIERAKQLYDAAQEHDVVISDIFETWGYSAKSSGGFQTIGALKMYGILKSSKNSSDQRKLGLSTLAIRYFKEERPENGQSILMRFALTPKLLAGLWGRWSYSPPADHIARSQLKVDWGLSEQSARTVLGIYKENFEFAGLKGYTGETEIMPGEPALAPGNAMIHSAQIRETPLAITASHIPDALPTDGGFKALLDGERFRISADVDLKGAKRLMKWLRANITFLEDDDLDETEAT